LVGKDAIVIKDGKQITNSAKGCCRGRCSIGGLVFDE